MRSFLLGCIVLFVATVGPFTLAAERAEADNGITMVVMDPLAAPLACDCVAGYAQRQYGVLAIYLEKKLGRPVRVVYGEELGRAIRSSASGRADLIIGKQSVVEYDAAERKLKIRPVARLTGKDGKTTLTGMFCVPTSDPAQKIADLGGYRILFGPEASAEKHAAAIAALKEAGVAIPEKLETREACSESALVAIENEAPPHAAAVISSYAMALLEGCGTIDPGSLRIIGHTKPLPFVTAFTTDSLSDDESAAVGEALLSVGGNPVVLKIMESKSGFVPVEEKPAKSEAAAVDWPQWRGPNRDGLCPWLPEKLSAKPTIVWKKPMTGAGLAGITATAKHVLVADRDRNDVQDIFRCLDAATGEELWKLEYPAIGDLDYGNSPRAAPLIHDGKVYTLGAFGDLHCLNLDDGAVVWKQNITKAFGAKLPTWGMCASPLVVDGKLIVNPGAVAASLVALDPATGKTVWQSPGQVAAYSAFIVGTFGGKRQIVGYDAVSAGGWDVATGKRLWQLFPPEDGDFNVPTPIEIDGKLLLSGENNGTRLYDFDAEGKIVEKPLAENLDLAPDTSTAVVVDGRVFGAWADLFCLDASDGLKPLWTGVDWAYEDHVAIIANDKRMLITSVEGELLLVGTGGEKHEILGRVHALGEDSEVLSHPALVGKRLYIRDGTVACCVDLGAE